MPVTTDPWGSSHQRRIEQQAESLIAEKLQSRERPSGLVRISGGETAGKSALLRELYSKLGDSDKKPILVSPPAKELDAGPVALLQLGVGLKQHGVIDGRLDDLTSHELSWAEKLARAQGWLAEFAGREDGVLLLDEPLEWPSRAGEELRFCKPADDVAQMLFNQGRLQRVVAGRIPTYLHYDHSQPAELGGDREHWLTSAEQWGQVAGAAAELAEQGRRLEGLTPLAIRLLVALQALGEYGRLRPLLSRPISRRRISTELRQALGARADRERIRKCWARMALVRGALDDDLLAILGLAELDAQERDLVRCCLLYSERDRLFMHESLRRDATRRGWLQEDELRSTHRRLAAHYREAFRGSDRELVGEAEAYHHAMSTGDADFVCGFREFFVEQLDALGKVLSYEMKQYATAVTVYERAIRWDPEDDYAHHYLAYNLDVEGRQAARVERHYEKALELETANAYWHSRWITFLITRSRLAEARQAWDDALDALELPDAHRDGWIYEKFHIWVARLLIHRGQLDFARDVLDAIPVTVRSTHLGMQALARRLEALFEAQRVAAVFPLWLDPREAWTNGPHLAARRDDDDRPLRDWRAGRVDAVAEGEVHLIVAAAPVEQDGKPTYTSMTLAGAEFDRLSRDDRAGQLEPGKFIEIVWYHGRDDPIIRVHQKSHYRDDELPRLFPDPGRYLRASNWID